MRKTIFIKLFLGYFVIILVITGLILLFSFRAIKTHYTDTLRADLVRLGTSLQARVVQLLEEDQLDQLNDLVSSLGEQTRITVVSPDGVVVADTEEEPAFMENHRTRPEVIQALKGRIGLSVRYSTTVNEEMIYVALPLQKDGQILGVIRMSLFLSDINRLLNQLKAELALIAALIIGVSLFAAAFLARHLSRPIRQLKVAASRVAAGDFAARVFLKRQDELKELADGFNYMTDRMRRGFDELSRQREELNSIISSLLEGLIVLDRAGKIVLSNKSFEKIIADSKTVGRYYWEVIREPRFGEWVGQVTKERRGIRGEISIGDRNFLCSGAFLDTSESVVVIFHDITEMRDLDRIKKDFIVNISHELRTPLTAIKGFAETLEDEKTAENHRRYLNIIKRHTDRLIRIVNDLLLLSEMEERGAALELEDVNINSLIDSILRMFERQLQEKNLYARVEPAGSSFTLRADPFKLEQMFINLIDNAIKYTEKGGITITLRKDAEHLVVTIADTGLGISREHMPRIFERFYVTDKSRSKRLGGTGLGLSIVKHIVLLHNGDIAVESTPGKGTVFTVSLPMTTAGIFS